MVRKVEAYQSDGKGGVKKVLVDEPDEVRTAREKNERLDAIAARLNFLEQYDQLLEWARTKGFKG